MRIFFFEPDESHMSFWNQKIGSMKEADFAINWGVRLPIGSLPTSLMEMFTTGFLHFSSRARAIVVLPGSA